LSTILFNTTSWRWQAGPRLPSKRVSHCAANINETTSFVAGGFKGPWFNNLNDAYLYHWPIDRWVTRDFNPGKKPGQFLPQTRKFLGLGTGKNRDFLLQ
jgi:hypothetical protein